MARVSRQTARLDSMLTVGLDKVERTAGVLETAVAVPVRQANGIFAAVKAIVETYRSTVPPHRPVHPVHPVYADPIHDPDRDLLAEEPFV
jgi:hypothetical protein